MANKLVNMKINEVSVVDKAANGKKFLIIKRDGEETAAPEGGEKINESLLSKLKTFAKGLLATDETKSSVVDFDTAMSISQKQQEDWAKDSKLYDGIWALRDSIDSISDDENIIDKQLPVLLSMNQFFNYLVENNILKAGKKISNERMTALTDMHKKLGELLAGAGDNNKEDKKLEKDTKDHVTGCMCEGCITKRANVVKTAELPVDIQKRLDTLEKRNKDLEADIKKQNDEVQNKEFITKAASFSNIGIDANELGPILKSMAEFNPEGYKKLEATLAAANAQIEKGQLFAEVGADGVGETEITKRVDAMAKEIQKRDGCTIEKARTLVYQENKELYAQHQKEMTKGR